MDRLIVPAGYLALLWAVHIMGVYTVMGEQGVAPGDPYMIQGIIAGALLHSGEWHIMGNTTALIPLLVGLALVEKNPLITLIVLIFSAGVVVWFIAEPGSGPHHGASDMIFALAGYLVVAGIKQGHALSIVMAGAVVFLYGAMTLAAIQPDGSGSSWEGHLAGLIVGLAWGFLRPNKAG